MKKLLAILIFLFVSVAGFAQPSNARVETINGKEYYIHVVKRGETLSGIAKKYKSSLAEVLNNNPGKEDRIDIGDKIKIPVTSRNRINPTNNNQTTNNSTTNNQTVPTNKKIIEHKVQDGETVYGISRKYKTTPEAIYELNPAAKEGINPGQLLKIETSETGSAANNGTVNKMSEPKVLFNHTVLAQETIFSLSRKYNISQDSIKLLNNGLTEGLKANSVIQLAAPQSKLELYKSWEAAAATVINNNQGGTNTMSDPENILNSSSKVSPSVYKTGKKDKYNVGLMIPFWLDKNKTYLEEQDQKNRLTIYEPTRQAMDFYMGVQLALDSMKQTGIDINLQVFDVTKDSASYKKIFQTPEFKNLDLLIGPFDWIELTAKVAKENKIPMLIPVACSNKVLLDNPFAFKTITTSTVIADETSRFVINKFSDQNIILVDAKGKNDVGVQKSYKKFLNKYYFDKGGKDSIKTTELNLTGKTIPAILRKDKMNVLIIPSNDFAYVSSTLSNLNKFMTYHFNKDYHVTVIGTDEWVKWDQLDILHKLRCNVHVPTPTFVDFDTLQVQKFVKGFRNHFKTDPDKYALMGFDLAYFWMAGYSKYGLDFAGKVEDFDINMNQTRFIFTRMNETSGCLNKNVYILKYENYKLIPQNND